MEGREHPVSMLGHGHLDTASPQLVTTPEMHAALCTLAHSVQGCHMRKISPNKFLTIFPALPSIKHTLYLCVGIQVVGQDQFLFCKMRKLVY